MIQNEMKTNNIIYYRQKKESDEGDFFQFISLILGILGFILKIKWACWLSLIFLLSSYVNMKYSFDQKQIFMNFSLILMGFVMVYLPQKNSLTK